MSRLVVLMYHAVYSDLGELAGIDPADRPYAVSLETFERQLELLATAGLAVVAPAALGQHAPAQGGVVLTFDDGHGSNYHHAMPALARRGLSGVFFLTRDFIGKRPGFCTWPQVREMAAQGMLIGTHGCSHRFFDDLSDTEAQGEFADSKKAVEDHISMAVDQMSFPGGRFRTPQLALGRAAGYRLFHSSQVGSHAGGQAIGDGVLRRIAVRAAMQDAQFMAFARAEPAVMRRAQAVAGAKQLIRGILGNSLYHHFYEKRAARQ